MRVTNYEVLLNEDRIPHLVKESARNYAGNSCLTNPSQIAEFMRELYHADILPEEKLWMIAMNTKCKPLGVFELAHGSMDSAVMDQKQSLQDCFSAELEGSFWFIITQVGTAPQARLIFQIQRK